MLQCRSRSRRLRRAFPCQCENVHALGAKCKRRWHACSRCFPARKKVSSNEPGSVENGSTLRYIVACTRNRDVMLYEDVSIGTLMFDRFKVAESTTSTTDVFEKWNSSHLQHRVMQLRCYTRAILTFDLNLTRFVNVTTDAQHIHSTYR